MTDFDYLDGYMYHMTHIENLRSILEVGALISQQELDSKEVKRRSIANEEVQNLRRRIFIWNFSEERYRPLHCFVPFYFTSHTPMLRYQQRQGIQDKIVIFVVSRAYIGSPGVIFTDGNASNQQLSKSMGETVYITPAAGKDGICRRKYLPDGRPYGTNTKRSDFYCDGTFLSHVNWGVINRSHPVEYEEYKHVVHAEILVDRFPLDEMLNISANTQETVEMIRLLFSDLKLDERELPILYNPRLFYS
jgi:hypothetical protein